MNNKSTLGIIFAAGGSSRRFGGGSKLFADFDGKPLFIHSLLALCATSYPAVLVVSAEAEADFRLELARHGLEGISIVRGGHSRPESVFNGVHALSALPEPPDFIAIHDAARPLADNALLQRCLDAVGDADGAIAAHRVTDTIHRTTADGVLLSTPPRHELWGAETPQVFRRTSLCRAFAELPWRDSSPTDEAALVASLPGAVVKMVENPGPNPKITFRADLSLLDKCASDR
jgi:2-C-methyl-D-erythritol 4-phosphate cytidylyltransferase